MNISTEKKVIKQQGITFLEEDGLRERMTRARIEVRENQRRIQ